ncbi:lysoplasmalogenase [Paenibacillus sp. N1-5-1-14]|uniref:lysoplasmalogenase n=1 Tax=Paenibacillus radicibacter TaxID=2972488 RepID=UPI002159807F|nr:lysoplasmalogenase [Paenibacillus radicibacter]MCR8644292.1 lysoplasmalogenase [Paenibacillus radicibacter]
MFRNVLIAAILVTGAFHLATLYMDNEAVHWVFKLLPMLLILTLAIRSISITPKRTYKLLMMIGLVFCLGGDAFLLNTGDQWFILGLGSFLIGHLIYIVALLHRWHYSLISLLSIIPIGIYAWWVGSNLYESMRGTEGESGMWLPVLVYLIAISSMLWVAMMSRNSYAALGAGLFVVSDSILAWNKFVGPVFASGFLVMLTYFIAQLLLACSISGVMFHRKQSHARDIQV